MVAENINVWIIIPWMSGKFFYFFKQFHKFSFKFNTLMIVSAKFSERNNL